MSTTSVQLAGIPLRSPILAASGCAGTGRELAQYGDLSQFGAIVTRSITTEPQAGLPSPRLCETPSGLINALGLPGPGIDAFLDTELPWLNEHGVTVIVSIVADSPADFGRLAQRLRQVDGVAGVEVNLSNPLVAAGQYSFAMDPSAAGSVVHAVRRNTATGVPVFAKLAGDVTDIVAVARSCVAAGCDGLSLINAVRGFAVDADLRRPGLGSGVGGVSGPAIKPIALRAVWQVHQALPEVAILASGGVATGRDAAEMMMAGASAVAIGTAILSDPAAGARIHWELLDFLSARDEDLNGLVGCLHHG
jgi:dihydroorotate dehydrogenase (NAD+) catalytic subunit